MRNLIFGSTVWVIRVDLVFSQQLQTSTTITASLRYVSYCVVYYRPLQSCLPELRGLKLWIFWFQAKRLLADCMIKIGWLFVCCHFYLIWVTNQWWHKLNGWYYKKKIKKNCLAGNTLALAVIIRLTCSPGLTLFSSCLLVVHEHFDIWINRSSYLH